MSQFWWATEIMQEASSPGETRQAHRAVGVSERHAAARWRSGQFSSTTPTVEINNGSESCFLPVIQKQWLFWNSLLAIDILIAQNMIPVIPGDYELATWNTRLRIWHVQGIHLALEEVINQKRNLTPFHLLSFCIVISKCDQLKWSFIQFSPTVSFPWQKPSVAVNFVNEHLCTRSLLWQSPVRIFEG